VDARRSRAARTLFVVAVVSFGLDRITKIWAEATLPGSPIEVVPGVLTLRFTTNSGGAFSIGQSAPWFFVGVSAVVVAIILATSFRHTSRIVGVGLGLVLGGALGNLSDRFRHGEVIDWLHVVLWDGYSWPDFNFADSFVVVGVALLIYEMFASEGEGLESSSPPGSAT